MGVRNRLKGPAAPSRVLQTDPRCVHSTGPLGAGPQEKPREDTASVWGWPAPCPWTRVLSWVSGEGTPSAGVLCALHPAQEESCPPRRAGCGTHGVQCTSLLRGPCLGTGDVLKAATAEQSRGQGSLRAAGGQPGGSRGTARGVSGGAWRQECERDRRAREGHAGALLGAGAPSESVKKGGGRHQLGGLSPSSHGPATPGGS